MDARFSKEPHIQARPDDFRPLPTRFARDGFRFRQLMRRGVAALFTQWRRGRVVAYEVYRVRVLPAVTLRGRLYPRREVLPADEQWGRRAWSFVRFCDAWRKWRMLAVGCPTPSPGQGPAAGEDAPMTRGERRLTESVHAW
jgi:hypothetical protein